jgi:hypothetical protein
MPMDMRQGVPCRAALARDDDWTRNNPYRLLSISTPTLRALGKRGSASREMEPSLGI